MSLDHSIPPKSFIALDAMVFIYYFEGESSRQMSAKHIFERIRTGDITGITSTLTYGECLSSPKLTTQQLALYHYFFREIQPVRLIDISLDVLEQAAFLRRKYTIHTPDAIHLATAILEGCQYFLTNDRKLKKVEEIQVISL